jgi:16S rRNA (guanine527-N7)-methyltransferase
MSTTSEIEWFKFICEKNGLRLSQKQIETLESFAASLKEWNVKVNLISRKDESEIWKRHILHSLSLLFMVRLPEHSRIVDIGTGGGFPGIPLSIVLPGCYFTLLDSIEKKIDAVESMVNKLELTNVDVVCGRSEELSKKIQYQQKYNFAVARAVAPLSDLLKWSKGFLKRGNAPDGSAKQSHGTGGIIRCDGPALIAYKGGDLREETSKIHRDALVQSVNMVNLAVDGYPEIEASEKKIVILNL